MHTRLSGFPIAQEVRTWDLGQQSTEIYALSQKLTPRLTGCPPESSRLAECVNFNDLPPQNLTPVGSSTRIHQWGHDAEGNPLSSRLRSVVIIKTFEEWVPAFRVIAEYRTFINRDWAIPLFHYMNGIALLAQNCGSHDNHWLAYDAQHVRLPGPQWYENFDQTPRRILRRLLYPNSVVRSDSPHHRQHGNINI